LVAVVSDSAAARVDITRENVMGHQHVLDEVLRRADVLPASFGTVAGSDEEVREKLLRRESVELRDQLEYVHGRVEVGLKVLWDRERLFAEIAAENDQIRALRDSIAGQSPDASYFDRIALGQLTEAAVRVKSRQEADTLLEALESLAVEARLHEDLDDTMLLNASFLVDRARVQEFDARVAGLGERQAGRLVFRLVGSLPPYSFVNLRVTWEG